MRHYVLLVFLLLALGCKKETEKEPAQETFTITTLTSEVMPQRFVVVNVNVALTEESYTGQFGGQTVQLYKSSNSELVFTVPDVSAGNRSLELTIDDKLGELDFTVSVNEVVDADQVLETQLITPLTGYTEDINEYLLDNTLSNEATATLQSANQMIADFMAKYNTLSVEEKQEVAEFFHANPFFTDDFLKVLGGPRSGNPDYDCFTVNSEKIVLTTIAAVSFVSVLPQLVATGPVGSISAFVGLVAGVYAAHAILSVAHEHMLNDCFLPYEQMLADNNGSTNNFEVSNGTFHGFTVLSTDRHLVSSDVSSGDALVALTVEKINLIQSKWEALKNGLNTIISATTNWFGSWLGSSSSNYELVSYTMNDIPSTSEQIASDGDSEYISIDDLPSDVVVVVNTTSDNSINMKLIADEATLPRTVTGKVKYDDGNFTTEKSFSVTITNEDPCLSMTAPSIQNVTLTCSNNGVKILVDFIADGNGALIQGGSGWCDPADVCYPVRLYFLNPGATEWSIGYNGYSVDLVSGNTNQGTAEITLTGGAVGCQNGLSPEAALEQSYPGYLWKVELMNECNQRSAQYPL